jgi:hypothetical protein
MALGRGMTSAVLEYLPKYHTYLLTYLVLRIIPNTLVGHPPPFFSFLLNSAITKRSDSLPPPPDHPIGHISGCGWS